MSVSSDEPGEIECSMYIAGLISDIFRLQKIVRDFKLPINKTYSPVLPINNCDTIKNSTTQKLWKENFSLYSG